MPVICMSRKPDSRRFEPARPPLRLPRRAAAARAAAARDAARACPCGARAARRSWAAAGGAGGGGDAPRRTTRAPPQRRPPPRRRSPPRRRRRCASQRRPPPPPPPPPPRQARRSVKALRAEAHHDAGLLLSMGMMRAAPAACGDSTTSCSSSDVGATSCASSDASAASTSALGDSALQLLLEQQAAVARETAACRLRLEQPRSGGRTPSPGCSTPRRRRRRRQRRRRWPSRCTRRRRRGASAPAPRRSRRSPRRWRATRVLVARRRRRARGPERGGVPHRHRRRAGGLWTPPRQVRWLCVCACCVALDHISNDDVEPSANAHMHASHTHCPFRMSLSRKSGMPPAVWRPPPRGRLGSVGTARRGQQRPRPRAARELQRRRRRRRRRGMDSGR